MSNQKKSNLRLALILASIAVVVAAAVLTYRRVRVNEGRVRDRVPPSSGRWRW